MGQPLGGGAGVGLGLWTEKIRDFALSIAGGPKRLAGEAIPWPVSAAAALALPSFAAALGDAERGGYFNSRANDRTVIVRLKEDYDGAEPAPNSTMRAGVWENT